MTATACYGIPSPRSPTNYSNHRLLITNPPNHQDRWNIIRKVFPYQCVRKQDYSGPAQQSHHYISLRKYLLHYGGPLYWQIRNNQVADISDKFLSKSLTLKDLSMIINDWSIKFLFVQFSYLSYKRSQTWWTYLVYHIWNYKMYFSHLS